MLRKLLVWLLKLFGANPGTQESSTIKDNEYNYVCRNIMTNAERVFFNKMKILNDEYIIIPQLQLGAIVSRQGYHKYQNELNRRIDFAIFNKNYELLLLIELNDSSHKNSDRYKRDLSVKNICKNCNLKLITFYTNMPNEQEYIVNRIKSIITGEKIMVSVEDNES